MGMILMIAVLAGGVLGLATTAVLGVIGAVLILRNRQTRPRVVPAFVVVLLIALPLWLVAVQLYPYAVARAGSDYDIVMANLFIQSLGVGAGPGIAVLVAALVASVVVRDSRRTGRKGELSARPR
jgi:hypothetical protein